MDVESAKESDICIKGNHIDDTNHRYGTSLTSVGADGWINPLKESVQSSLVIDHDYEDIALILNRLQVSEHQNFLLVPCINITCSCSFGDNTFFNHSKDKKNVHHQNTRTLVSSCSSSDTDSDENDDSFKLAHLFRAFTLYENKTSERKGASLGALRNLVNSYNAHEDVGEEETLQIIALLEHRDMGLQEMALLTIKQLCVRENSAFKFLFHDIVAKVLLLLEMETTASLHEPAAFALEQVLSHAALQEWWLEQMKMGGFTSILNHLSQNQPLPVRYACACVMRSLVQVKMFANSVIDHAMEIIGQFKTMNSDFQEVYTEIMSRLLIHADDIAASVLNVDALPASVNMLTQGPCGPQQQSLVLISTLAKTPSGLESILENKVTPLVLSALVNTDCKKVRENAAATLARMTASTTTNVQKQLLLEIDEFYHAQSDNLENLVADEGGIDIAVRQSTEKTMSVREKMERAIEDFSKDLIRLIQKEGKMEKDLHGEIVDVHMSPCIDVNAINLNTICELLTIMRHLILFSVVQIKVQVSQQLEEQSPNFIKEMRQRKLAVNLGITKTLVETKALTIVDLLSVYTQKLLDVISIHDKPKSTGKTVNQVIFQAWQTQTTVMSKTGTVYLRSIFDDLEIKLITNLIQTIEIFAKCSSVYKDPYGKQSSESLETVVSEKISLKESTMHLTSEQSKIRKKGTSQKKQHSRYHSKAACELCRTKNEKHLVPGDSKLVSRKQTSVKSKPPSGSRLYQYQRENSNDCDCDKADEFHQVEAAYEQVLQKELAVVCRNIRASVFEYGVIESVGPWLLSADKTVQESVLDTVNHMIQPLEEKVMPSPPKEDKIKPLRNRPVSAMTSKERDHAMNLALYQMSTRMKQFIQEAIYDGTAPQNTPREAQASNTQLSSPSINIVPDYDKFARFGATGNSRPSSAKLKYITKPCDSVSGSRGSKVNEKLRDESISMSSSVSRPSSGLHEKTSHRKSPMRRPMSGRPGSSLKSSSSSHKKDFQNHSHGDSERTSIEPTKMLNKQTADVQSISSESVLNSSSSFIGYDSGFSSASRSRSSEGGHRCRSPPRSAKQRSSSTCGYANSERCSSAIGAQFARRVWVPWKPQLNKYQPIAEQCRSSVATVIGKVLLRQLFAKDVENRKKVLNFMDAYIKHGQVSSHLKMSELGIIPKMVDFLRVNDEDQLLEMMGLSIVQDLVKSDIRLKNLFHRHGGTQLLMAMTSCSTGILKEEVADTLKVVSQDGSSKRSSGKRIRSAPPLHKNKTEGDIWDNIMERWKHEDKVTTVLQKFT